MPPVIVDVVCEKLQDDKHSFQRKQPVNMRAACILLAAPMVFSMAISADDIVIEDFESGTYDGWKITGTAFGNAPAAGTLPRQMPVSGFRGHRLVNTFMEGDKTVGTATSREFLIERPYIAFLIGGGPHKGKTGIELLVGDKPVRSATGPESETLEWASWDVHEFQGKMARLRIFDNWKEGWGHINIDHIIQTGVPPKKFDLDFRLNEYRRSTEYMNEPFRPQAHFSPEINWMNDPNGLVWHNGEYHLFHQYNPAGNSWGHMSWGHAVSTDLVHWKHLPLAIPETGGVMAFSGCCVVDHENTSNLGSGNEPPMVAIYTGHGHGKQVQNLAWSNDNGRTWTIYDQNPVLDINNPDFRDPKVFRHEASGRWIMVVSLAAEKRLVFYGSSDLKTWQELSRFGPAGAKDKPNWECPDLFELNVENEDGKRLWVLEADMGSGSIAGGSGGEYFVGRFDGTVFTPIQDAQWVDFGRDFYAPVSWSNIPEHDGRRIWMGWFNNWETCLVPTHPWRSCMSVPRELSLRRVASESGGEARYVLIQRPVREFTRIRAEPRKLRTDAATWPPVNVTQSGEIEDLNFTLNLTLRPGNARSCGLRIVTGDSEFTEIGYDRVIDGIYVDRRRSGNVEFHAAFSGRHEAPARVIDGCVELQLIVDRSTLEVFVNDGEAVISDRFFPSRRLPVLQVFAGNESAGVTDAVLWPQRSIWPR